MRIRRGKGGGANGRQTHAEDRSLAGFPHPGRWGLKFSWERILRPNDGRTRMFTVGPSFRDGTTTNNLAQELMRFLLPCHHHTLFDTPSSHCSNWVHESGCSLLLGTIIRPGRIQDLRQILAQHRSAIVRWPACSCSLVPIRMQMPRGVQVRGSEADEGCIRPSRSRRGWCSRFLRSSG